MTLPLLVMGGTGRIAGMLRAAWADAPPPGLLPLWQARSPRPGFLHWDILSCACPEGVAAGVILCLAGGRADTPETATALALAALRAARDQSGRHVFIASSAAVYGPGVGLAEDTDPRPANPYGLAKVAMERAALEFVTPRGTPGLTLLRIGNVAGCDALLGGHHKGPVILDPVPGREGGPVRSYIGPASLARVIAALCAQAAAGARLPRILNIAAPRPVAMADLLVAAGMDWAYGPPNPQVIPSVTYDTATLQALVPLSATASDPTTMVAEWRQLSGQSA
jgi:nucleoside-diphosphate-sugar epimerase